MAIEFYSTDDDLVMIRPNILELGISCWEDQHKEAFKVINRILIGRWYKQMALEYGVDWRETEFDPELVDKDQLVRLSCYKTLEFAYLYLMKDSPEPDGFEREMELFRKRFADELQSVLAEGVTYDWNKDDSISSDERYAISGRRLLRA